MFPTLFMKSLLNRTEPSGAIANAVINYMNNTLAANETATNASSAERENSFHRADFDWPEDDDMPVR